MVLRSSDHSLEIIEILSSPKCEPVSIHIIGPDNSLVELDSMEVCRLTSIQNPIVRSSDIHNGVSYIGKIAALF